VLRRRVLVRRRRAGLLVTLRHCRKCAPKLSTSSCQMHRSNM
jgi:hypothetical protein